MPSICFEYFHIPESSFNAPFRLVEQYLVPKRNTQPDAIFLDTIIVFKYYEFVFVGSAKAVN